MNLARTNQYDSVDGAVVAIRREYGRDQSFRLEGVWPQALLGSARTGSAGVAIVIAGYAYVGTSPSMVDSRTMANVGASPPALLERSAFQELLTLSVADQAREVLAALSLNKSQLAEVLGVSRPTLYDWLDGKEPNASNSERLTTLLRLLNRAGITSASPLNARFVRQPLDEEGTSLLASIGARNLDDQNIIALLGRARSLGDKAESRRRGREERLRTLGYDEPSDEQRKGQIANNVAMRDWPKT